MSEVTVILERLGAGDEKAMQDLVPLVYQELRRRARHLMSRPAHTLQPTALVHEAFLKLVGSGSEWRSSRHFYNAAAEVMRQILIDYGRRKGALKRGGGVARVELPSELPSQEMDSMDWEALNVALEELKELDQRRYQVVMLRYFAGLSDQEVAAALEMSQKTVQRDWATARAFLRAQMERTAGAT